MKACTEWHDSVFSVSVVFDFGVAITCLLGHLFIDLYAFHAALHRKGILSSFQNNTHRNLLVGPISTRRFLCVKYNYCDLITGVCPKKIPV